MGKQEYLLGKIEEWEAAGLISTEQATALKQREAEGAGAPAPSPRVQTDEIFVYLGSLVVFLALAFLVGLNWSLLGSAGRILAVLVPTVLMLALGWRLRSSDDVRLRRGSQALWLVACLLSVLTWRVIFDELGLFVDEDLAILFSFGLATGMAWVLFRQQTTVAQSIALHLCGSGAVVALLFWLARTFPPFNPWRTLVIGLLAGGLWLWLAGRLRGRGVGGLVTISQLTGALTMLGGAVVAVVYPHEMLWQQVAMELIAFLLSVAFIAASVKWQSQPFLYCGAASLLFLIVYVNLEHFADTVGMPVVLLIVGVLLIGLGLGTGRLSRRIAASKSQILSKEGAREGEMDRAKKRGPYFVEPARAPRFAQMEGLETTVLTGLHGERMMMVLNATLPGHTVPTHSHPHEQVGMVHSGRAILRIGDEEREVEQGDFFCIPAGVPHSDTTLGDEPFVMLDVFCPVREDFVQKVGGS